jgi:hypothetical protein
MSHENNHPHDHHHMPEHPAADHKVHNHDLDHQGEHAGHDAHGGHGVVHSGHEGMFRQRFWVCLLLTIPVLLYSPMLQQWFGVLMPELSGSVVTSPLFAIAIGLAWEILTDVSVTKIPSWAVSTMRRYKASGAPIGSSLWVISG